jgi:hypothetical protein
VRTLTLEQVREAGLFAWRPEPNVLGADVFVPDVGVILFGKATAGIDRGRYYTSGTDLHAQASPHEVDPRAARTDNPFMDGWHHLPGCDCEFCTAP